MSNRRLSIKKQLNLLIHLIVKIINDDIFALASQLAYHLLLSFLPFIIFLITLVGFSNLTSIQVLNGIKALVPNAVFDLISSTVVEVFDKQHTGLLEVSILLALWTSSSGFKAVIKGVNKAYNFKETRSFIKTSIISMISILALAITIILALIMLVFGNVIENYIYNILPFQRIVIPLWNIFRYVFVIFIMVFIFATIYRFAPPQRLRWKEVIPGSIFSTIGWMIISYVFSFYINNFSNYSRFYGSVGAVFILMTWLFLVSMIFILGVEINCVLEQIKNRN
ncbi:YihY/virulence factor BrkB family protein [Clostridium uliginosum]|uniref:Membrane protein n=1 Tax=Clostridium uliginosum TaxID=119641 RepID=A0A1I1QGG7_9CLOT|nr:YihY/virulence factor BrkB family protein [Clostridium uliginosum]SFD21166.1 membrane protein [Clostridium uliginosum]